MTMMASPTLTSAAATTMMKKTNNCPSVPAVDAIFPASTAAFKCIFENATSNRLTAFNINSMHIKIMIALRRVNTPTIPMQNKARDRNM